MLLRFIYIREINERERNFGLDLLRSIAICLVLAAHGSYFLPPSPMRNIFLMDTAFFGVEIFFILSGFLIGNILLKLFSSQQKDSNIHLVLNFWLRRWFRTLPNYYLFLILNITLFKWLFSKNTTFGMKYLLFLQNFAWPYPFLMPESWSLAVEEWFYILFPIVMLVFIYLPISRKKSILTGLIVYLVVSTAIRFIGAFSIDARWEQGISTVVIYRLDAIGYGVLFAYLNFFYNKFLEKFSGLMLFVGCILIVLSISVLSYGVLTTKETLFNKTMLFTLTSIGLALLLPWFKGLKVKNKFIFYTVTHISVVSYSMYLIHYSFVIPILFTYFPLKMMPLYIVYIIYVTLTMILSTIVYKYYERPMTSLRGKFTKRETNLTRQIAAPDCY